MLQMILMKFFAGEYAHWQAGVLATDISPRALQTAIRGVYPLESIQRLPKVFHRYFRKVNRDQVEVVSDVRREVMFRRLNLIAPSWPFRGKFHVIFCRNVMIYFDNETRQKLLRHFHQYLAHDGYLFIGHSESIRQGGDLFKSVIPAVYQKKDVGR